MQEGSKLQIGCVADDFTGAGDAASFLSAGNARCLLINGVPRDDYRLDPAYEAVVIALKTRNCPAAQAQSEALAAFDWLKKQGARTLYFKYCSTFDSTPEGNIGPVLDALLEHFQLPYTILCPALPVNNRTVKKGKLYVNGVPLDESPMRYHPVNPMWDSRISVLMEAQSRYPCFDLTDEMLDWDDERIFAQLDSWSKDHEHFYVATDYYEDHHGHRIARLFGGLLLLSGGSALPQYLLNSRGSSQQALILAGSCSKMTRKQISHFVQNGGVACQVFPSRIKDGSQTVDGLWQFVKEHSPDNVLLFSSQSPQEIGQTNAEDQHEISRVLEELMGELARRAKREGIRRIIVAGGETSGAVMQALGGNAYEIGRSAAPGVPILLPLESNGMQLVLKSGNFGQDDFFLHTLKMMERRTERA